MRFGLVLHLTVEMQNGGVMLAWTCGRCGCVCGRPCEINVKTGTLGGT